MSFTFGRTIRTMRERKGILLTYAADQINIDAGLLSKIEQAKRFPSKAVTEKLSVVYGIDLDKLMVELLSDRIFELLKDEAIATDTLKTALKKITHSQLAKREQ